MLPLVIMLIIVLVRVTLTHKPEDEYDGRRHQQRHNDFHDRQQDCNETDAVSDSASGIVLDGSHNLTARSWSGSSGAVMAVPSSPILRALNAPFKLGNR